MPGELLHKGSLELTAEGYGPPWPEEHGSRGVREQKQMNAGAFLVPSSPWFIQPEPPEMRWCYPHSGRLFLLNPASAETPSETHPVVCLIGNQANNEDWSSRLCSCSPLLKLHCTVPWEARTHEPLFTPISNSQHLACEHRNWG